MIVVNLTTQIPQSLVFTIEKTDATEKHSHWEEQWITGQTQLIGSHSSARFASN